MAGLFKVPAPVAEMKRQLKRALSPQPSTSSAPEVLPKEFARKQIPHPAYEHLDESIRLTDIGQLRGLKSGRRRGRWRRMHLDQQLANDTFETRVMHSRMFDDLINNGKNYDMGLALKFGDAMKLMEPLLMDEILTQQSQHTLVASALEHFATVINHIVDDAEDQSNTQSGHKRTTIRRMFEDFEEDPPAIRDKEEADRQSSKEEDENTKTERIRFETAAAVFALLQEQKPPKANDKESAQSTSSPDGLKDESYPKVY